MWWPFCCRSSCCRWRCPKREDFTMLSPQMLLFSFLADKNAILQMKAFNKQVDPVKQHFPHPRGGNKLQLQCCPAPPLINPRWLSDRSLGPPAAAHMQLTLGEQSWRQPRRTLHHLIEMKSVTPWPVFQHPHQHPPPHLPPSLWPVSPAAALRWRAAGVKTPSATELLGVNEPCSICAWRALFLVRALLRDAAQLCAGIFSCSS